MDVIRQANDQILNMLGPNILDNSKEHRLMKYLLIEDIDNGKAVHNELTRAFIWMPNVQWETIYNNDRSIDYIDFLWRNYFLVNDDFDERDAQQQLKENLAPTPDSPSYLRSGHLSEYTIYTTMGCNARCNYCYEKGRKITTMNKETANKVGDYIVKASRKDGYNVSLRWFGGEPLVNENAIDIICQKVKDAGYNYQSDFTSNGFLFKREKIDKYVNLWHINTAQITLDGTEHMYNKIKNYKNVKGKNPYRIVLDNIKMLAFELNVYVNIRINLSLENADNIKELITEIYKEFGIHNNINPYVYPVFDTDDPRTDEENEILFTKLKEIQDIMRQYGYFQGIWRNDFISSTHCMCDIGSAIVIGTGGEIGLCEHYSEDNFWGHIDKPEMRDENMIRSFKEYVTDQKVCFDCPILPSCIIPLKCADLRNCNIWKREWRVREAHYDIIHMYLDWKNSFNNQNNQCNNQCGNQCNEPNQFNNQDNNQNNQINQQIIQDDFNEPERKGILGLIHNLAIKFGLK